MEIRRERFSQLNPCFKTFFQYKTTKATNPAQQLPLNANDLQIICPQIQPIIRPPQRQKARSRQQKNSFFGVRQHQSVESDQDVNQQYKPISTIEGYNSATKLDQISSISSKKEYITLTNLTNVLHTLQNKIKLGEINGSDKSDTTTSSRTSAKQRVQQHLQNTASRWWKHAGSSATSTIPIDQNTPTPTPTIIQQAQLQDFFPMLTIVNSNSSIYSSQYSSPQPIRPKSSKRFSTNKISTISADIQTTIATIPPPIINPKIATVYQHQEPLIISAKGIRLHSINQQHLNYIHRQRLVR
ncbi:unnamed protein product [Didymodactylos carnosus]|uniref:Uncharacterized protein n=1 Tax=Didymodactylos carnosus TaxID=1234261 RepID=A0A815GZM7_9BILA|nr:unnamed protein product [Didymodactylos carnosus]CAF1351194.1 unnamed protein product [Didymodactylos carnosus]CAF4161736.1 unnamed protein product [Didymodactylos carnosus]CAF4209842.1 unnamed protein product [Didymodactylos carnosus]